MLGSILVTVSQPVKQNGASALTDVLGLGKDLDPVSFHNTVEFDLGAKNLLAWFPKVQNT